MRRMMSRVTASITLVAGAIALAGCEGAEMEINGQKGVPLAEVEIAGPAPTEVVLSSGDTIILTQGDTFALKVEGTDTDSLRFVRDGKVIGVTRTPDWNGNDPATIRITMPPPKEIVIAGTGTVKAQTLAVTSEVSIGGTGTLEFGRYDADKLTINIGGSGDVSGAGTAKRLEVNVAGTGNVNLAGLKAVQAEVSIGGTGDVLFASDGTVEANIAGTGDVVVTGTAKCTVSALGTGTLTCAPPPTREAVEPRVSASSTETAQ